jgi:hypothetical protein
MNPRVPQDMKALAKISLSKLLNMFFSLSAEFPSRSLNYLEG